MRYLSPSTGWPTLVGVLLPISAASAQEPFDVVSTESVVVEQVGRFDFASLNALPSYRFYVFPTSHGWAVSSATFGGEVFLFDDALHPTGHIGRNGHGPEEFSGIPLGGRLPEGWVAVDPGNQKALVLDADEDVVRSFQIPGPAFSVQTSGESLILGGEFSQRGSVFTVVKLDLSDSTEMALGAPAASFNPRRDLPVVLPPFQGEIWAVKHTGGLVEILAESDLAVVDSLQIPLPGYDLTFTRMNPGREPPPPQVLGASSENGLAYLYVGVADSAWVAGLRDPDAIYDTEILVIAMAERAILGVNRFPGFCQPMKGNMGACLDSGTGSLSTFRLTGPGA